MGERTDRVQLQTRIDPAVKARLQAAAERRLYSTSRLVEFAVTDLVDRLDAEDGISGTP